MTADELHAAVTALLDRSDLAAHVPLWHRLARGEMNTVLRHPDMETYAVLALVEGQAELPADCLDVLNVEAEGASGGRLCFRHRNAFDGARTRATSPQAGAGYTIQGRFLLTYPSLGESPLEIRYLGALGVPEGSGTDWLLTRHPNADLYGTAMHGYMHTMEGERATMCRREFMRALDDVTRQGVDLSTGPNPVTEPSTAVI